MKHTYQEEGGKGAGGRWLDGWRGSSTESVSSGCGTDARLAGVPDRWWARDPGSLGTTGLDDC